MFVLLIFFYFERIFQLQFMIVKRRSDVLTVFVLFYDIWVSRNLFSKAEMRQFGAAGTERVNNPVRMVSIPCIRQYDPDFWTYPSEIGTVWFYQCKNPRVFLLTYAFYNCFFFSFNLGWASFRDSVRDRPVPIYHCRRVLQFSLRRSRWAKCPPSTPPPPQTPGALTTLSAPPTGHTNPG